MERHRSRLPELGPASTVRSHSGPTYTRHLPQLARQRPCCMAGCRWLPAARRGRLSPASRPAPEASRRGLQILSGLRRRPHRQGQLRRRCRPGPTPAAKSLCQRRVTPTNRGYGPLPPGCHVRPAIRRRSRCGTRRILGSATLWWRWWRESKGRVDSGLGQVHVGGERATHHLQANCTKNVMGR